MKLVIGPAKAIPKSVDDLGGSFEISAIPQNKKSVIPFTLILYFIATIE